MECPCGKVFVKNVSGSLVLKAVTLPLQGKKGVKRATIDERTLRDGLDNDTVNTPFVQSGSITCFSWFLTAKVLQFFRIFRICIKNPARLFLTGSCSECYSICDAISLFWYSLWFVACLCSLFVSAP